MGDPDQRVRAIGATLLPGFVGASLPETLRARLASGLGGVCVFGSNIVSERQLRELNDDILATAPHAVIAVDEEGGDVTRLNYADGSPFPGNAVLGRLDDASLTERVGRAVGLALLRAGCTIDFAPDVDVNSNPDNPVIGVRSFGTDPLLVGRHGAAWATGLQSTGVGACAKHFPGHGDTALDSHLALPVVDRSLRELHERELVPFRAAIDAGVLGIMTSHILLPRVDPDRPATFSRRIVHGLLREELGFGGVVVTDALDMRGASGETGIPEAAVRALEAGCDLLCIGTDTADDLIGEIIDAVAEAIDSGRLSADRVADAAGRVRTLARLLSRRRAAGTEQLSSSSAVHRTTTVAVDRVLEAFEVRETALSTLRAAEGPFVVVRIATEANVAIGAAPWGPFAQVVAEPGAADSRSWSAHPEFVVAMPADAAAEVGQGEAESRVAEILAAVPGGRGVVVVGKANHRHPSTRVAIDALRAARPTLVVDMGWPSDDRAYADVCTFGASRLVGRALMDLLETV